MTVEVYKKAFLALSLEKKKEMLDKIDENPDEFFSMKDSNGNEIKNELIELYKWIKGETLNPFHLTN